MKTTQKILFLILLLFDLFLLCNIQNQLYLREILEKPLVCWSYIFINAYFLSILLSEFMEILEKKGKNIRLFRIYNFFYVVYKYFYTEIRVIHS